MRLRKMRAALLLVAFTAARGERWKMQYFYDVNHESLRINDLACPTARRCIAIGDIAMTQKNSSRPVAVVTGDGGAHWTQTQLPERPLSLFLLDDSNGWMVGVKSLWKTQEAGRSWQRVAKLPANTFRVHFLDAMHGWAIGGRKSVFETVDGGKAWKPVPAAKEPKSNPEHTAYSWITFVDKNNGMITGFSRPPRGHQDNNLPDWMDPETAENRRQWPTLSIVLETRDGGRTWMPGTGSIFGRITRARLLPGGLGLGLITYDDSFEWTSELIAIDWKSGKSARAFRDRNFVITDVALISEKMAFLAGEQLPGKLRQNPVPGKLKILKSSDFSSWKTEMEVDYRATATRAMLAAVDATNIWVATDTGMILKLEP
jgi:hypothetical protein